MPPNRLILIAQSIFIVAFSVYGIYLWHEDGRLDHLVIVAAVCIAGTMHIRQKLTKPTDTKSIIGTLFSHIKENKKVGHKVDSLDK